MAYSERLSQFPLIMSDHYQYVDTYYRSSYSDGENMDSGATHFNYGYPSEACYGFDKVKQVVRWRLLPHNVVRFCAHLCIFVLHVCS